MEIFFDWWKVTLYSGQVSNLHATSPIPYFVNPFVDILLIDAYVLSIPEDSLSTFIYILVYKIMEFQISSQISIVA